MERVVGSDWTGAWDSHHTRQRLLSPACSWGPGYLGMLHVMHVMPAPQHPVLSGQLGICFPGARKIGPWPPQRERSTLDSPFWTRSGCGEVSITQGEGGFRCDPGKEVLKPGPGISSSSRETFCLHSLWGCCKRRPGTTRHPLSEVGALSDMARTLLSVSNCVPCFSGATTLPYVQGKLWLRKAGPWDLRPWRMGEESDWHCGCVWLSPAPCSTVEGDCHRGSNLTCGTHLQLTLGSEPGRPCGQMAGRPGSGSRSGRQKGKVGSRQSWFPQADNLLCEVSVPAASLYPSGSFLHCCSWCQIRAWPWTASEMMQPVIRAGFPQAHGSDSSP